ncbi:MAG: glycosyltransferase [Candidatus Limnocylindrales bacterium]
MPDQPLRLAFLGDGNSIHVQRWIGWFADRGHAVTLLLPDGFELGPVLPNVVSIERFAPYYGSRFKPAGMVRERRSLRRVLARLRPDVLHAHFLTEYGWHAWMSGFHPYAITVWGSDVTMSLRRARRTALYGRVSLRSADMVTGDSVALVEAVIEAGARRDRTRLVQFGVDTARFSPGPDPLGLRRRLDLVGRRVLFSPRLIRPLYRQGVAVEALRSLPEDVVLLMTRYQVDEAELAAVLARAQALGVGERVRTVPSIDHGEMPDFYRMAEAVLTIPETDATPVTLLEAMATERPVVATDLPSVREWLGDLDPETLVPVGDVVATAAAIARVLGRGAGERLEMGRGARAIVEERAGQDVHMRSVEAAYRQLAAGARQRGRRQS